MKSGIGTTRPRRIHWLMGSLLGLVLLLQAGGAMAEPKKFTMINVVLSNTKIWLPSTIVVNEGDEVELKLVNKHKVKHGFGIPAFKVRTEVLFGKNQTVTFTADKAGVYPFVCQLHAPHVGGQVVVMKK